MSRACMEYAMSSAFVFTLGALLFILMGAPSNEVLFMYVNYSYLINTDFFRD